MPSRSEELRAKLRNKTFDEAFFDFSATVEEYLKNRKSASAGGTEFMKKIYQAFKSEKPENVESWIHQRLNDSFLSKDKRPVWVTEPDWCFHDDEPMKFISQFSNLEEISFYVYSMLYDTDLGKRVLYKMIAQDREGKIRLQGDIRG